MHAKLPTLTIAPLIDRCGQRLAALLAYVTAERDCYRRHGSMAGHRLDDDDRRRFATLGHDAGWTRIAAYVTIATIRTLRRWYRLLVARQTARPRERIGQDLIDAVIRFARENSYGNDAWGRRRISGECAKLGMPISPSSVRLILRRHGIPPAPDRGRASGTPCAIASMAPATTVAIDFASVRIIDGNVLRLLYVLIAIHLGSRRACIIGISEHPDAAFVAQCARNLTMADHGFLVQVGAVHVVMDRDTKFTEQFQNMLRQAGHECVRIPPRCPWMNGYAERLVRTLKDSVLKKVVFTSQAALQAALDLFIAHYEHERPHQGLGNGLIREPLNPPGRGAIVRRSRVGGLINHYEREAG